MPTGLLIDVVDVLNSLRFTEARELPMGPHEDYFIGDDSVRGKMGLYFDDRLDLNGTLYLLNEACKPFKYAAKLLEGHHIEIAPC